MPFCTRCGKEALEADSYCTGCGQPVVRHPVGPDAWTMRNDLWALNYCPSCGVQVRAGQSFCERCGVDLRARRAGGPAEPVLSTEVRGLARNRLVYMTREGLTGVRISSEAWMVAVIAAPLPLLAAFWYTTGWGSLATYITLWLVSGGLLFDWLKWRGLRKIGGRGERAEERSSWRVSLASLRGVDWNGKTLWFSRPERPRKVSITFDRKNAPRVESNLRSQGVNYSWRPPRLPSRLTGFWSLVVLVFVASQVVMFMAATLPFFPGEQQVYTTVLNSTRSQVVNATMVDQFRVIYFNNLQVAWGSMVPGLGAISFAAASYNTGRVIQVIALSDTATLHQSVSPALVYLSLFFYPHSWVEEASYPIAVVAGVLGITRWRSVSPEAFARFANRGSTRLALALVGVALSLMVAGALEVSEPALGFSSGAFLLWVPVLVGGWVLYVAYKRRAAREPPQV